MFIVSQHETIEPLKFHFELKWYYAVWKNQDTMRAFFIKTILLWMHRKRDMPYSIMDMIKSL